MLTITEQAKIISVLGKHYSGPILREFDRLGIRQKSGGAYQAGSIRKFVTRKQSDLEVELAIMKFVKRTEKKKAATVAKRKDLMKKR